MNKQEKQKKQINDYIEQKNSKRVPRGWGCGYDIEYSSIVGVYELNEDKSAIVRVDSKDVQAEIDRYAQGLDVASIVSRYTKGDTTALNPNGLVSVNSKCDDGYFDASCFSSLDSLATLIDRQKNVLRDLEKYQQKQQEVQNVKTSSPAVDNVQKASEQSETIAQQAQGGALNE